MPDVESEIKWYEGDEDDDSQVEETNIPEYDISASPNDFNIKTLFDFISSGIVKIPGFQRNYVWDRKRASKLIESLVIGIPIPQIFLYEEAKNKFIVIDGQQRYMTIYYFIKKRFPKEEKRFELRKIFEEEKGIPESVINDNQYFIDFNLQLPGQLPNKINRLDRLNYFTFDDETKTTFELRTIRNIIIKQNFPEEDDSIVYEIFNRLNSGGVNLKPQEIRSSLYHSKFYEMVYDLNMNKNWRSFTWQDSPDLHMKDIEILLRGFAMLVDADNYKPSLTKFINKFSNSARKYPLENTQYLNQLMLKFLDVCIPMGTKLFIGKNNRFNICVFESIFHACCEDAFKSKDLSVKPLATDKVDLLKSDPSFNDATQSTTASSRNVALRLKRAKELLF